MDAPWTASRAADLAGVDAPPAPAGFWRRAAALLVDAAVVWALLELGGLPLAEVDARGLAARAFAWTYTLGVPAAYFVLSHGTGGRTLGKRLTGARVETADGHAVGYPRALARYLAWWLSAPPLAVGFLMAAARRDRRALHDLVAGTRVVRTRGGGRRREALLS
jgi:uncharacterized RDD family membrane protein YckC